MKRIVHVCFGPGGEHDLRVVTLDPVKKRSPLDYSIVTTGYRLSHVFDGCLQEVLEAYSLTISSLFRPSFQATPMNGEDVNVSVFNLRMVRPPLMRAAFYTLGAYKGDEVFALWNLQSDGYVSITKDGFRESVAYALGTIRGSLDSCAEAAFFTDFLEEALMKLHPQLIPTYQWANQ